MKINLHLVYSFHNQVTGSLVLFSKGTYSVNLLLVINQKRFPSPLNGVFHVLLISIKLLRNYCSFMKLNSLLEAERKFRSFSLLISLCSPRKHPPKAFPRSPAGDVSRRGTSATQQQKFHTDDVKSVRNPVRSADWSTE